MQVDRRTVTLMAVLRAAAAAKLTELKENR